MLKGEGGKGIPGRRTSVHKGLAVRESTVAQKEGEGVRKRAQAEAGPVSHTREFGLT